MKYIRAERLAALQFLEGRLRSTPDMDAEQLLLLTNKMMEKQSERLFLAFAIEGDQVHGFILGYYPGMPWAQLVQMDGSDDVLNGLFTRFVSWAEENGLHEIRHETLEGEKFNNEWGFVPHSLNMKFDTNLLPDLLAARTRLRGTIDLSVVSLDSLDPLEEKK